MVSFECRYARQLRAAPLVDLLPPRGERLLVRLLRLRAPDADHVLQHMRAVADDRDVDLDVLVDRRRVDVDVDLARAGRERVEPPGDAVVEARADAQHHVAVVHRPVRLVGAVHAEHAEPLRIGRRIGAEPHQRGGDREAGEPRELAQQVARLRPGIDDAAARIDDRPLRLRQHFDRGLHLVEVALELRLVGLDLHRLRALIGAGRELHVLRDVDHHRSRPAVRRDVEGFVQHARQVVHALHQVIVLGAGPRDADRVAFLERVVADQMRRHLAGDAHDRDRVHQRVGQAGHRIGGAGTRGDQHAADLAGRARVAFRRVHRALLVPHQDVAQLLLLEHGVVDRKYRAARIPENVLDPLIEQGLDHHLGAGHFWVMACSTLSGCLVRFRATKKAPEGPCTHRLVRDGPQPPPAVRATTTIRILRMTGITRISLRGAYKASAAATSSRIRVVAQGPGAGPLNRDLAAPIRLD